MQETLNEEFSVMGINCFSFFHTAGCQKAVNSTVHVGSIQLSCERAVEPPMEKKSARDGKQFVRKRSRDATSTTLLQRTDPDL